MSERRMMSKVCLGYNISNEILLSFIPIIWNSYQLNTKNPWENYPY